MKRIAQIAAALLMAGPVLADPPAAYPITVNSKADTVASITAYRANSRTYRVSFTDGTTASVVTSRTPFMAWATNSSATTYSTANWAYVSGTTGQVDFTFAPAAVNYAAGRYVYEVGVKNGTIPTVYRQGVFIIQGSPIAQGVSAVTWSSNINWSLYEFTGTSGYGPVRPDGSTIICTTNGDGSITIVATGSGGATWASVSGKPTIITQLAASNGVNLTALNASSLSQGTVPLARLSGITSSQVATATDTAYRNPASYNAGALTGNVPVAVEQTISHTNLAGANSAADVQHLSAAEKNTATGPVDIARIPTYIPTNTLPAVQGNSNQVTMIGQQVRVIFNTNFLTLAWIQQQGYGSTNGNWAGTWQGKAGAYYFNTNQYLTHKTTASDHAYAVRTNESRNISLGNVSMAGGYELTGGALVSANRVKMAYLTGTTAADIILENSIDGRNLKITNFNGRADSMYVEGGQTNNGVLRLAQQPNWNGTNTYLTRTGSVGGTNSLFWTVNGTNYHLLLE